MQESELEDSVQIDITQPTPENTQDYIERLPQPVVFHWACCVKPYLALNVTCRGEVREFLLATGNKRAISDEHAEMS